MDEIIKQYIDNMKISAGLNTELVFQAWDEVSGAAQFTLNKFFRDGTLYITLSSSMVRSQLMFQRDALIKSINAKLLEEPLFSSNDPRVGLVQKIILK